jgi:hypothetical protein
LALLLGSKAPLLFLYPMIIGSGVCMLFPALFGETVKLFLLSAVGMLTSEMLGN